MMKTRPESLCSGEEMQSEHSRKIENPFYPEGGWGWVVAGAFATNTVLMIKVTSVFNLIFKDLFKELQMSTTLKATIMTVNTSFNLLFGIFTGRLLQRFGYRKLAVVGTIFGCAGMLLTGLSQSSYHFLLNYGIIMSLGIALTSPAYALAVSSYFKRRRSLAAGIAKAATGLAGIAMPLVANLLIQKFGTRGTIFCFAGFAVPCFGAAALLRPVRQPAQQTTELVQTGNLEDAQIIVDEGKVKVCRKSGRCVRLSALNLIDVSPLANPSTVILLVGLSVAACSELNFSQFLPFILDDVGMAKERIALCMSLMQAAGTISKLAVPFVRAALRLSSKNMYMVSIAAMITGRIVLLLVHSEYAIMGVLIAMAAFKGFVSVCGFQVVPDNVPHEQMAAAIGLHNFFNGVFYWAIGPLIGLIHDMTGSFHYGIIACSVSSSLCIFIWCTEYALPRRKVIARCEVDRTLRAGQGVTSS